ncbi:hypothetical protein J6TS1_18780 [Siminovitchia terrae]|uniref:Uncharacterized protein n=1 Tax=Siminovitchia terrae TaxID=1914933 RepID=A0ABQ4KVG1_SIMTE|nr:hypothetical protein J22TS1_46730 [Siminovitchia terrae]GIN96008.1 hypothetical protein J6TS1_18780 [Siminovitchia terrae]
MAVLTELRERVRVGDVSIVGSRQYRDFEEYLFSEDTWNQTKEIRDYQLVYHSKII